MCSTWPGECLINPRMEHYGKFEDKSLITEVLVAMPARVENTLIYYRTKILGRSPQTETPMIQLQYWQLFLEETGWWSWTCQKIGKMRNSGTWYPRPVQMKNNYRYFLCISMINEVELFLRNGSHSSSLGFELWNLLNHHCSLSFLPCCQKIKALN